MTEKNDNGESGEKKVANLEKQVQLNEEQINQAERLGKSESEINALKQQGLVLQSKLLKIKSEDLSLSVEARDAAREELATLEDLIEGDKERLKLAKEQKALQDDILDSIGSFGGKFKKGFVDKLIESNLSLDQVKGKFKETFTLANSANMLGSMAFSTVTQSMFATVAMAGKAQADLAKATGTGFELAGAVGDAASGAKDVGVGFAEAAQAIGTLSASVSAFSSLNRETQAEMGQTAAMLENVGVSAAESAAHMDFGMRIMGKNGKEAAASAKDMAKFAKGIGVAPAQMAKDFQAAAPQIASYGKNAEKVFKGLARQSKKLGISMNELLSITQQFDTFDGAFDSAGKLNSLLGGQFLDSMELMTAETEEQRVQLLQNALAMSGQSFDAMSRHEKMAVANSIGITDMSVATKLLSKENQALAKQQQEKAISDEEFRESMSAGIDVAKKMMLALQGIAVAVMPLVEMLSWAATVVVWFADTWVGKGVLWVAATAYVVYQGVRLFKFFASKLKKSGKDVGDGAKNMSEGVGGALENLSKSASKSAKNIGKSLTGIAKGIGQSVAALMKGIGDGLAGLLKGMAKGLQALAHPKVVLGGLILMGIVFSVAALVYAFSQLFTVFANSIDIMPELFLSFLAFSVILNFIGLSFAVAALGIQVFTVGLATMLVVGVPAITAILLPLFLLTVVVGLLATAFVLMGVGLLTIAYGSLKAATNFGALATQVAAMKGDMLAIVGVFAALAIGMLVFGYVLTTFGAALALVAIPLMLIASSIVNVANAIAGMATAVSQMPAENALTTFMTTVNTIEDGQVDNLEEMMDQAQRYVFIQAQMNAVEIANSIADGISDVFGLGGESDSGKQNQKEIVLKLNEREFARAVVESLDGQAKISLA